jgi:Ca-activated chloride channel family protein
MLPDSFLAPGRLWLLLLLPLLLGAYLLRQRGRRRYAVRFSAVAMLGQVAPRRPGWRRHVVAAGLLATLGMLVVTFARPAGQVEVPRERATIVLAIDVSLSMEARDVSPNRLSAAQDAARDFIAELPPRLNLGIVSFAGSAQVLVPPTTDRRQAAAAIDALELEPYTAIGEGIFTSLRAVEQVAVDPSEPDTPVPARIVLLSDGETTVGRSNEDGVLAAREADVPVSTIAFGTPDGTVVLEGVEEPVPVGKEDLADIARDTGGQAYEAETLGELEEVYDDIGSSIGFELVDAEVTSRFAGYSLALLVLSLVGSLGWFGRLP